MADEDSDLSAPPPALASAGTLASIHKTKQGEQEERGEGAPLEQASSNARKNSGVANDLSAEGTAGDVEGGKGDPDEDDLFGQTLIYSSTAKLPKANVPGKSTSAVNQTGGDSRATTTALHSELGALVGLAPGVPATGSGAALPFPVQQQQHPRRSRTDSLDSGTGPYAAHRLPHHRQPGVDSHQAGSVSSPSQEAISAPPGAELRSAIISPPRSRVVVVEGKDPAGVEQAASNSPTTTQLGEHSVQDGPEGGAKRRNRSGSVTQSGSTTPGRNGPVGGVQGERRRSRRVSAIDILKGDAAVIGVTVAAPLEEGQVHSEASVVVVKKSKRDLSRPSAIRATTNAGQGSPSSSPKIMKQGGSGLKGESSALSSGGPTGVDDQRHKSDIRRASRRSAASRSTEDDDEESDLAWVRRIPVPDQVTQYCRRIIKLLEDIYDALPGTEELRHRCTDGRFNTMMLSMMAGRPKKDPHVAYHVIDSFLIQIGARRTFLRQRQSHRLEHHRQRRSTSASSRSSSESDGVPNPENSNPKGDAAASLPTFLKAILAELVRTPLPPETHSTITRKRQIIQEHLNRFGEKLKDDHSGGGTAGGVTAVWPSPKPPAILAEPYDLLFRPSVWTTVEADLKLKDTASATPPAALVPQIVEPGKQTTESVSDSIPTLNEWMSFFSAIRSVPLPRVIGALARIADSLHEVQQDLKETTDETLGGSAKSPVRAGMGVIESPTAVDRLVRASQPTRNPTHTVEVGDGRNVAEYGAALEHRKEVLSRQRVAPLTNSSVLAAKERDGGGALSSVQHLLRGPRGVGRASTPGARDRTIGSISTNASAARALTPLSTTMGCVVPLTTPSLNHASAIASPVLRHRCVPDHVEGFPSPPQDADQNRYPKSTSALSSVAVLAAPGGSSRYKPWKAPVTRLQKSESVSEAQNRKGKSSASSSSSCRVVISNWGAEEHRAPVLGGFIEEEQDHTLFSHRAVTNTLDAVRQRRLLLYNNLQPHNVLSGTPAGSLELDYAENVSHTSESMESWGGRPHSASTPVSVTSFSAGQLSASAGKQQTAGKLSALEHPVQFLETSGLSPLLVATRMSVERDQQADQQWKKIIWSNTSNPLPMPRTTRDAIDAANEAREAENREPLSETGRHTPLTSPKRTVRYCALLSLHGKHERRTNESIATWWSRLQIQRLKLSVLRGIEMRADERDLWKAEWAQCYEALHQCEEYLKKENRRQRLEAKRRREAAAGRSREKGGGGARDRLGKPGVDTTSASEGEATDSAPVPLLSAGSESEADPGSPLQESKVDAREGSLPRGERSGATRRTSLDTEDGPTSRIVAKLTLSPKEVGSLVVTPDQLGLPAPATSAPAYSTHPAGAEQRSHQPMDPTYSTAQQKMDKTKSKHSTSRTPTPSKSTLPSKEATTRRSSDRLRSRDPLDSVQPGKSAGSILLLHRKGLAVRDPLLNRFRPRAVEKSDLGFRVLGCSTSSAQATGAGRPHRSAGLLDSGRPKINPNLVAAVFSPTKHRPQRRRDQEAAPGYCIDEESGLKKLKGKRRSGKVKSLLEQVEPEWTNREKLAYLEEHGEDTEGRGSSDEEGTDGSGERGHAEANPTEYTSSLDTDPALRSPMSLLGYPSQPTATPGSPTRRESNSLSPTSPNNPRRATISGLEGGLAPPPSASPCDEGRPPRPSQTQLEAVNGFIGSFD
jgi:hypothetical protein